MTRAELLEEIKNLREALHAIAEQVDEALGNEPDEDFDDVAE